jgi:hypothetical protein
MGAGVIYGKFVSRCASGGKDVDSEMEFLVANIIKTVVIGFDVYSSEVRKGKDRLSTAANLRCLNQLAQQFMDGACPQNVHCLLLECLGMISHSRSGTNVSLSHTRLIVRSSHCASLMWAYL